MDSKISAALKILFLIIGVGGASYAFILQIQINITNKEINQQIATINQQITIINQQITTINQDNRRTYNITYRDSVLLVDTRERLISSMDSLNKNMGDRLYWLNARLTYIDGHLNELTPKGQ